MFSLFRTLSPGTRSTSFHPLVVKPSLIQAVLFACQSATSMYQLREELQKIELTEAAFLEPAHPDRVVLVIPALVASTMCWYYKDLPSLLLNQRTSHRLTSFPGVSDTIKMCHAFVNNDHLKFYTSACDLIDWLKKTNAEDSEVVRKWKTIVIALVNALRETFRETSIYRVRNNYSCIPFSLFALYVGYTEQNSKMLAMQHGWEVDETAKLIKPKKIKLKPYTRQTEEWDWSTVCRHVSSLERPSR